MVDKINMQNQAIIYDNGEIELKVSLKKESVWLNRNQLAELFDRDVKTIGKHINNVFREKELENSVHALQNRLELLEKLEGV